MAVSTGLNRLFGVDTQARISELRRATMVAMAENTGPEAAAGTYPVTVAVVRRQQAAVGNRGAGVAGTWAEVAGLTGLVAHVRTRGKWADLDSGAQVDITDAQRIVMIADIPAAGGVPAGVLLTSDRLRFTDAVKGATVWEVKEARVRQRDGICVALCEYARED